MPSFLFIRHLGIGMSTDELVRKLNELSIENSKKEFKEGILPRSVETQGDIVTCKFGFEYELNYETLQGVKRDKALQKIPIHFLRQNFVAFGYGTSDIQEKVLDFLSKIIKDCVLTPLRLKENTLRKILDKARDVRQFDLTPVRRGLERVDRLKCIGREITDTELWEDYGSEPLAKIKVNLEGIEEATVSFDKRGVITIHQRRFSDAQHAVILNYVAEMILAPYVGKDLQKKLIGDETW